MTQPGPLFDGARPSRPTARSRPEAAPRLDLDPGERLFREQAIAAYRRGENLGSVVRLVRPATWVYLACLSCLVLSAAGLFAWGHLELSATARGALQGAERPALLISEIAGTVKLVHAREGEIVARDAELISLDSTVLKGDLLKAEARQSFAAKNLKKIQELDESLYREELKLLGRHLKLASGRARSAERSMSALKRRHTARKELWQQGLISRDAHELNEEQLREVERGVLGLLQEMTTTDLEIRRTLLERQRLLDEAQRESIDAERALEAVRLSLDRSVIRASRPGRLEGLTATPGQVIPAGALLGRVVSLDVPTHAVIFVDERDRAFLAPGAAVWFEVDRLPLGEFGALRGRVVAIDKQLATAGELTLVLGDRLGAETSGYAVQVALDGDAASKALLTRLESGALVTAHVSLRRQRLATLLFGPLRRWLQ